MYYYANIMIEMAQGAAISRNNVVIFLLVLGCYVLIRIQYSLKVYHARSITIKQSLKETLTRSIKTYIKHKYGRELKLKHCTKNVCLPRKDLWD